MQQVTPATEIRVCGACNERYEPKKGHSCAPTPTNKSLDKKAIAAEKKAKQTQESMRAVGEQYWVEFKHSLLKDLPPFMLPSQIDHIVKSHKAAFDMGVMAILEGIRNASEETEIFD